ncbi:hypothetical protein I350_07682 [Cryptococcus amylolentus CBS 6273]|uniref:Transcription initiation factor IIF subunit beta n=1 Tax=Cryptococcus amylolentus CBS 6273 TaxID=1296118 RepID=A0A1E3JAZ1_9TREE|nr:hypothetical protein I350_07682 [Cryptococcus amylolentus CBS 6273]
MSAPSASSSAAIPPAAADDERLLISDQKDASSIWAIKVPNFLLRRWEEVQEGGIELGRLLVDNSTTPPKVTLRLTHPNEHEVEGQRAKRARYDTEGIPDEFDVNIPVERSKNTYVFSETKKVYEKGSGSGSGDGGAGGEDVKPGVKAYVPRDAWGRKKRDKANPKLVARVDHEGHVQPVRNAKYLQLVKERGLDAEKSKRPIVRMEDTGLSQAEQNQLASGFKSANSKFGSNMILSNKPSGERFARLERHELTDRIFQCFRDHPYWALTSLKQTLEQPEAWLREVLKDVSEQVKDGQYQGYWQLKAVWKEGNFNGTQGEGVKGEVKDEDGLEPSVMSEIMDDDEVDDDDDDDMEEVI